ncbi:MAG: hypothetical protein QOI71_3110 [Gaiellales bacterium]|jgi:uncharacterized HhH-GPD family protein|nr:hypothetical protein [Gaiellales bacterium]
MARTATAPERLPFTGDEEADRLIASSPVALLIGFVLDQQVTVQKAFAGPLELRKRLGHLDVAKIAALDPEVLATTFRERPALHRFPAAMADRVRALCAFLEQRYSGDAARIWREAESGQDLKARLSELPGFGDMKVRTVMTLLARQFGVDPPGIAEMLPAHQTLGDVRTAEELASYQAGKRAAKAARRAAAADKS